MTTIFSYLQRWVLAWTNQKKERTSNQYKPKVYVFRRTGVSYKEAQKTGKFRFSIASHDASTPINSDAFVWEGSWVPKNTKIEFKDRKIKGLVYFGKPELDEFHFDEIQQISQFYIDPDLEVAENLGDSKYQFNSKELRYDKLTPIDRANYLDWLAYGRCDRNYDYRYMALYFMGLEWRYFRGVCDESEWEEILDEIDRLYRNYQNGPYLNLTKNFIRYNNYDRFVNILVESTDGLYEFERMYQYLVEAGVKILDNQLLNGNHAYVSLVESEIESIEKVRKICPYVFEQVFVLKFNQKHPNGIKITKPTEELENKYESLLQEVTSISKVHYYYKDVPDIRKSNELQNIAIEIGKLVADELKQYSSEIEYNIQHILDNKCINFLPRSEVSITESIGDQIMLNWVNEKLKNPNGIVVKDLALLLNFENQKGFEFNQWLQIVIALERLGYGVVPELGLALYDYEDMNPVFIYELQSTPEERIKSSNKFYVVLLSIALGIELFQSENQITEKQQSAILSRIKSVPELTNFEIKQLHLTVKNLKSAYLDLEYFSQIFSTGFAENKEFFRNSVKEFAEIERSIVVDKLDVLLYAYFILGIDLELIGIDLNLKSSTKGMLNDIIAEFNERFEKFNAGEWTIPSLFPRMDIVSYNQPRFEKTSWFSKVKDDRIHLDNQKSDYAIKSYRARC